MRIDSHQHFWRYSPQEYSWIDDRMAELRRDFLPADLHKLLLQNGLDGSIAVQARQTLEETRWLLQLAGENQFIRGVVGWAPLASPKVGHQLEALVSNKRLKGVRHVLQGEPNDDYMLGAEFNRNIALLADLHLSYDILIYERHLSYASVLVDRHPRQTFILDHIAKPRIAAKQMEPWATHLRELAKRPNVYCKLSGMVTEADLKGWQEQDLQPYFDVVLQAFEPRRILFGSDWPVCLAATTYSGWLNLVTKQIGQLSSAERDSILGGTAVRAYRLN